MPERDILDDLDNLVGSDPDDASVLRKAREALKAPQTKFSPYNEESQKFGSLPDNEILDTIKQLRVLRRTAEVSAARDAGTPSASPEDLALKGQMNTWKAENPPPDSEGAKWVKRGAHALSWVPTALMGPQGLTARLLLSGLGAADVLSNWDKPPDLATSAAAGGLSHGLNKLKAAPAVGRAVFGDWNRSGLQRIATTALLGGAEGAAQAALPSLINDRGFHAPTEDTASAAKWGGALGALSGALVRGPVSSAANKSGQAKLGDTALDVWGSLAKPDNLNPQQMGRATRIRATERLSPGINRVSKLVQDFDDVSRQHREAVASNKMAEAATLRKTRDALEGQVFKVFGENPDAIPRTAIAQVQRTGVRDFVSNSLDTLLKKDPAQATTDTVLEQFKGLKTLARKAGDTGDKNLKAATIGYMLENFASPTKGTGDFLQRQAKALNYIANDLFPEDKELPMKLKKFVEGTSIAMREAFTSGDNDIGLYTSRAGMGVRIKNAWYKIKPLHFAEKVQQGKATTLASFGDIAGYLKDARKNPLQRARIEQAMGKMLMDFGFEKEDER